MPWHDMEENSRWKDEREKLKDENGNVYDGEIIKYKRITIHEDGTHSTDLYNSKTGVIGHHGSNIDKGQYGKDYDNFENNYGYHRK